MCILAINLSEESCLRNPINIKMENNNEIIDILKTKSSTKQEVYRVTHSIFNQINDALENKIEILEKQMKDLDRYVELEYISKGKFESHIRFSGDRLVFHMHSNVFDFHQSHEIHKSSYVKQDNMRSFCGVIHVYNFLNDSFKYHRLNDVGNLIARIFINKDSHYFVEGEKQLGFLFNDFVNQKIDKISIDKMIDAIILFTLNFDLLTPNFQDINLVNVHQVLDMNKTHKLKTSKSLGFRFSHENK